MLGDQPYFAEAMRAVFASDRDRFLFLSAKWPRDPRARDRAALASSAAADA